MLSTKNKVSCYVLMVSILIVGLLALTLRPIPHFAYLSLSNAEQVQVDYIWQADISAQTCQEKLNALDEKVLISCPNCLIKKQQCLSQLNKHQKTLLSHTSLPFPTIRLHDGAVAYQATDPQLALKACLNAQATQHVHGHQSSCIPSHGLRSELHAESHHFWLDILEMALTLTVAGLVSWFICYLILHYENLHAKYSHDHIASGIQKFHAQATPRIGGIALFGALLAAMAAELLFRINNPQGSLGFVYFVIASTPVFLGGLIEDVSKNVGVMQRLLFSMLSAAMAIGLLGAIINRTDIPLLDNALVWLPFAIAFTVLGISGLCNAMNIIDGYHGLSAGYASIALIAITCVAFQVNDHLLLTISVALLGGILGFLKWNWPHGKIFMGDGGAYLLGFSLAELAILLLYRNPTVSPWFTAILLAYPIVETLFSMFRRKILAKTKTGQPDAEHLHQLIFKKIVLRGDASQSEKLTYHNSRVCLYMATPAVLIASIAVLFWSSSAILMPLTLAGCVAYVLVYCILVHVKKMS